MAVLVVRKFLVSLFLATALFYLSFHMLHGEQGLYALLVESHRLDKLETELAEAHAKRLELEHRVNLMRDDTLDPDLLDEMARRSLGFARKDELLIITHR